ncbi:MAG TPA: ACT domain-containing protein [Propionibacterium sp.]|nr:ACT domain-containing protein [Propionibacterium sp.]
MAGLTNLHEILGALRPSVRQGSFVYVTLPTPPEVEAHARIVEDEGVTVVLDQGVADDQGYEYEEVFGWITLQAHTSLSSVGVTAAVATALARVGISCNVLAGYYHDHLLVPVESVDEAVEVLGGLES